MNLSFQKTNNKENVFVSRTGGLFKKQLAPEPLVNIQNQLSKKYQATTDNWTNTPLASIENANLGQREKPEVSSKILRELKKKYEILEKKHNKL